MQIEFWRIILLTLYAVLAIYDGLNTKLEFGKPMMAGMFAGIIMGDMKTGLYVGATLQLLILGVSNFGGATIPDYTTAALIATPLAIASGENVEFAIGLGIPIGLLMTQLDILARTCNVFLMKRAEKAADEGKYYMLDRLNFCGIISWGIARGLPVFLALTFGTSFVDNILAVSPEWLINGLKLAGSVLPAVGISILLKYLPIKKFYPYLIIGFVLFAYLNVPMLGIALLGVAIAVISYQQSGKEMAATVVNVAQGDNEDE